MGLQGKRKRTGREKGKCCFGFEGGGMIRRRSIWMSEVSQFNISMFTYRNFIIAPLHY